VKLALQNGLIDSNE